MDTTNNTGSNALLFCDLVGILLSYSFLLLPQSSCFRIEKTTPQLRAKMPQYLLSHQTLTIIVFSIWQQGEAWVGCAQLACPLHKRTKAEKGEWKHELFFLLDLDQVSRGFLYFRYSQATVAMPRKQKHLAHLPHHPSPRCFEGCIHDPTRP